MPSASPSRAVLTIAAGKKVYLDLAVNLARSFRVWHADGRIKFTLVTDLAEPLPGDLAFVEVVRVTSEELGHGFTSKLRLDRYAPAEQTLFIDADCLCAGSLDAVFERFRGLAVSVVGTEESSGHWCGEIEDRCRHFGLPAIPVFNGGIYYLERGSKSAEVYDYARALEKDYDNLNLYRLRDLPNEEPLVSLAMARFGCRPVPQDGTIKIDAMDWQGVSLDVLAGQACVRMEDDKLWYPRILHFNYSFTERPEYRRAELALNLFCQRGFPRVLAGWTARVVMVPFFATQWFRTNFRGVFHTLAGPRRVRKFSRA